MNQNFGSSTSGKALRVLMQNRPSASSHRGGDTVVMDKTAEGLRKRGVEVTIDLTAKEDPSKYDVVHLFNFALPELTRERAERAVKAGVPFVVTSLCEDVPSFHNQSLVVSSTLIQYVRGGQNAQWLADNRTAWKNVPPCHKFDNAWTVQNAAAVFTNGSSESAVIRRDYGSARIVEIPFGYEVGAEGDAEEFVRAYGVRDFIFCVARLESRKNQLMLLKALEDSELTVVFAAGGFSYQPEYDQAVRNFKRKGRTIVLDRISSEMLASAYRAARMHVLPSWYELPGLVSLEAAYYGKNVVVTANGTARDYFGATAFYCDPSDETSIRNAVTAAYYSPAQPGLREIAMQTNWDATAARTLDAYRAVVDTAKATARPAQVAARTISVPQIPAAQTWQPATAAIPQPAISSGAAANSFQELLEEGEREAHRGQYIQAKALLTKAHWLEPQSARCIRALGALAFAESDPATARGHFEEARRLAPKDAKNISGVGMCALAINDIEGAYKCFVEALEIDPEQLVAVRNLIECSYRLNRFTDLERVLRMYLRRHVEDIEIQYCLAGCLYKQGRAADSEQIVDAVLRQSPAHEGAKQLKDLVREELSRPQMSTSALLAAVEKTVTPSAAPEVVKAEPDSADMELSRLEEEKWHRNFDQVREACKRLLKDMTLKPSQREKAMALEAESTTLQNSLDEAAAMFDKMLELFPDSARGLCGKGSIAAHREQWSEAQKLFERAKQTEPKHDVAWAGLGLCYLRGGNKQTAWEHFQRATELNPECVRAILGMIELGYSLNRLPDVERAIKAYLDIHPVDIEFLYSLAGCYFAQNKLDEASVEVQKITIFQPDHKHALELKEMIAIKSTQPAMQSSSARM